MNKNTVLENAEKDFLFKVVVGSRDPSGCFKADHAYKVFPYGKVEGFSDTPNDTVLIFNRYIVLRNFIIGLHIKKIAELEKEIASLKAVIADNKG